MSVDARRRAIEAVIREACFVRNPHAMALRTPAKVLLSFLGITAVLSLALAGWLSETVSGKRWVKTGIERAVTANIPGRLTIARVVEIGPPLVAEDVRFYHYDGRLVLQCKHAEVVPDLLQALRGRLAFERAAVDGGKLVLSPDPDGRVAMEAAVDVPTKPGEPSDPNGGLHYAMQSMHVQNFRVEAKLSELADFKVDDVEGFVGIRRIETSGTVVNLERIRGRVSPGFLDKRTELKQLDGWVHGKLQHVAQLAAQLQVGGGELTTKLNVYDRDKQPVEIEIQRAKGAGDLVAALAKLADGLFGDSLEVAKKD